MTKPLIYYQNRKGFIFSSEIKVIESLVGSELEIDHTSVIDYFSFGSIRQPHTIYKDVYFLLPGHYAIIDSGKNKKLEKYYDLNKKIKNTSCQMDYAEAVEKSRSLLEEATKYHLISDVEVGAFLSGGLDSNAVVSLMSKYSKSRLNTFTLGFDNNIGTPDEKFNANESANYIGTNHHNITINDEMIKKNIDSYIEKIDQPSFDGLNTFLISKYASRYCKVILSGLGGDEIFSGYHFYGEIVKIQEKRTPL